MWTDCGNMCSYQKNVKPDELISSDCINPTMLASQNFTSILEQVQSSGLNFQLQVSPFSAIISLKKSFIKENSDKLLLPRDHMPCENGKALVDKNIKLENDIVALTTLHKEVVKDCKNANETIISLEKTLQESRVKV